MSYALLFAGQGGQHAGMLPWLDADAPAAGALSAMQAALGSHWRATLQDPALLRQNRFAQILLTGTSLAAWDALKPLLPGLPAVVAGYSVGELAAYACAGVLHMPQALDLAARRAQAMDQAAQGQAAGLMSVSGLVVHRVLQQHPQLSAAILMGADHAIFGARLAELEAAQLQLSQAGASCKRLPIDVASHTPWMAGATQTLARHLNDLPLESPAFPVVVNAGARACRRVDELRGALSTQISSTVDWAACMDAVAERGVDCVLEIGPGNALSTLWNRRHAAVPARALEDFQDAAGAARWVHAWAKAV